MRVTPGPVHKASQSRSTDLGSVEFFLDPNEVDYIDMREMILDQHSYTEMVYEYGSCSPPRV